MGLPIIDFVLMLQWIAAAPVIAIVYLIATIGVGIFCVKFAKVGFRELLRQMQAVDKTDARILLILAKLYIVGGLLAFPGYLSDIFAVVFWLLFFNKTLPPATSAPAPIQAKGEWLDDEESRSEKIAMQTPPSREQ